MRISLHCFSSLNPFFWLACSFFHNFSSTSIDFLVFFGYVPDFLHCTFLKPISWRQTTLGRVWRRPCRNWGVQPPAIWWLGCFGLLDGVCCCVLGFLGSIPTVVLLLGILSSNLIVFFKESMFHRVFVYVFVVFPIGLFFTG